ncbi:MAG: hypothetical protein JW973_17560 [Bacteroidales bacterium]|nr:hypothetical protein [Bacteroidales bacterium]
MKTIFFKKTMVLATITLYLAPALAQSPEKMSYQAVIRNNSDALVTNTQVGMQISILQGSASGSAVYVETQTPTTNANGLVSIEIGAGTVENSDFTTIDWANGLYFIKTETDPAGGASYTITGVSQLLSVPYALHAKTAETITGTIAETDPVFTSWDKDYEDLANKPDLTVYATKDMHNQNITNLADPVNAQDAATKAYVNALLSQIEALKDQIEPSHLTNGFADSRDGNHYNAVKIGNQIWMAENLKYLPSVAGPGTSSQTTPCYYVYGYDGTTVNDAKAVSNYTTYGVLYNWPAAMAGEASSTSNPSGVQGVCPAGWHLPSNTEWTELTDFLGGLSVAGGKLKETGTTHWIAPNTGATNETGFTALPGGYLSYSGTFVLIGNFSYWWSATETIYYSNAWGRGVNNEYSYAIGSDFGKELGFSVRCLRD